MHPPPPPRPSEPHPSSISVPSPLPSHNRPLILSAPQHMPAAQHADPNSSSSSPAIPAVPAHARRLPPYAVEAVSGLTAGLLSTLCVHPLDLIKTRLQLDRRADAPRLGSSLAVARHVLVREGAGWRGLYRGLSPNVVGNMTSWGLYFLLCVISLLLLLLLTLPKYHTRLFYANKLCL